MATTYTNRSSSVDSNTSRVLAWFDELIHTFTSLELVSAIMFHRWIGAWMTGDPGSGTDRTRYGDCLEICGSHLPQLDLGRQTA
ncbi:hypothetical protein IC232_27115 [Microvirga sp. BT688]|uniref:hypothetical protein n=1 Tax=Microvirga sp. TaxID=1873136 RepID=UPI001682AF45|nr:hypothetical protein [Microvirga sp.]MBD2750334.1 hypothetical protein [Microvirga sp.]